jgi:hypothetical protein
MLTSKSPRKVAMVALAAGMDAFSLTFARSPQNEGGGSQLLAIAVRQRGLRLSERCGGDLPS